MHHNYTNSQKLSLYISVDTDVLTLNYVITALHFHVSVSTVMKAGKGKL